MVRFASEATACSGAWVALDVPPWASRVSPPPSLGVGAAPATACGDASTSIPSSTASPPDLWWVTLSTVVTVDRRCFVRSAHSLVCARGYRAGVQGKGKRTRNTVITAPADKTTGGRSYRDID